MAYQQFKNISEAGEAGEAGDECRLLPSSDPAQPFDRRRSKKDTSKHIIIGCLICLLLLLSVTNATTAIYLTKVKQDLDYHRYCRTWRIFQSPNTQPLTSISLPRIGGRVLDDIRNNDRI